MTGVPYTAAQIVALLDCEPAAGILAAADLREQRAKATQQGRWHADAYHDGVRTPCVSVDDRLGGACDCGEEEDAEHIAAEANPAHALAAARRWRGVVERHRLTSVSTTRGPRNVTCLVDYAPYPCPDLVETADEVRAYLGGTA